MTSQINPNNINVAYPVAGQDNNTQGFRDNFTFIRNNFVSARDEINDLQTFGIVKGTNNDFGGGEIYNVKIRDMSAVALLNSPVAGVVTIDYAASPYQYFTTNDNITVNFNSQSFPPGGQYGSFYLEINVANAAHTVTFPSAVTVNTDGIQGFNASTNTVTFASTGIYTFEISTRSGGSALSGFIINESNKQLQPFNNSSEDLAPSAAASLSATTSYFTTAGAETATLAAGVEGQIKVLAMRATAGNMVITVSNAGWKTSGTGTVTFANIGDACTLQYMSAKWFCIGNNGCVFA